MKNILIKTARKFLFLNGYYALDGFARTSFSQFGEDLILENHFNGKKKGFYVDVGAYRPKECSNTYLLYLKGWRGINIDAMPGSMEEFETVRRRDINIEAGVSNSTKDISYYISNQRALNTFSKKRAEEIEATTAYKIIETKKIKTQKLGTLLDKYLPKRKKIDLLNIDVEGLDLEVLKSNNWQKYMPKVVIAESLPKTESKDDINKFLVKKGYELYAITHVSYIYRLKNE